MSRFLAPIHFWLFNKIRYHEDLEGEIEISVENKFGTDLAELIDSLEAEFGERVSDKELEDIINQENIHGWLADTIEGVEKRQARLIGLLIEKYGESAYALIEDIHRTVGKKYGSMARSNLSPKANISAPEIYKLLNDYILDGMPCDNAKQIISSTDDRLLYSQLECLHAPYWASVGLDLDTMYGLRAEYIDGFVQSLSTSYSYAFKRDTVDGQLELNHLIAKDPLF